MEDHDDETFLDFSTLYNVSNGHLHKTILSWVMHKLDFVVFVYNSKH